MRKSSVRPKVPRKKIELELTATIRQLKSQVHDLQDLLLDPNLSPSAKRLGETLLADYTRLEDLELNRINLMRLASLPSPLMEPNDFSIWLKHHSLALAEEIFHFISITKE